MKTFYSISLKLIFIGLCLFSISGTSTAQSFEITWNTGNPGVSNATSITIPTVGDGYDYNVDWDNNGTFDEFGITGDVTYDFGVEGIYTIKIQGDFPRIYFNNNGDRLKLISIDAWGDLNWTSFEDAFYGCENLSYAATDAPNLSSVDNLSGMFRLSGISTGDFSNWDVSNVTNMSFLFSFANQFDGDISSWDVSEVENFRGMFWGATQFNQPLNNWNVSNGNDMSFLFFQAENFNQDLDNWDVGSVTNMASMFSSAPSFNGKLSNWDVSQVQDMSFMFFFASAFNRDLGDWSIDNVTDMTNMLSNTALSTAHYDNTLIGWEAQNPPANITLGAAGLNYCESVDARNALIAAFSWTIEGDNQDCAFFTTTWQTNNPGTSNPSSITIPTTGPGYDYDVDWDNDGVFDEFGITGDITHDFGVPGVYTIKIKGDFPRIHFDDMGDKLKIVDISRWGNLQWESMASAFRGCANLGYSATDAPDLSNVTNTASMFQGASNFFGDLNNWDVSTVTDMGFMFRDAVSFNHPLSSWDVSNVTDMSQMFRGAVSFNQSFATWNVSNVEEMDRMFEGASSFNGDISAWDISNVTDLSYMFRQASAFNQNIGNWNTANVTDMRYCFSYANAFDQNLGNWDISGVTAMDEMLSNSGLSMNSYDQLLIGWATQNVQTNVALGADNLTYCEGDAARSELQNNTNSWTISGDERACAFITTWKTDNVGVSPNDAITIPIAGLGYNYDVDWNNDGVYDQFGINGTVSHVFAEPGTYTIRIRGDFPRIFFSGGGDRNKIISVDSWGDIEWQNMEQAFQGCVNLNVLAVDAPDLSQVTNMLAMFQGCSVFNADINHWDVSNVTDMGALFMLTDNFNQDLDNWDVSNVESMHSMFNFAQAFNGDISSWDVSSVDNMRFMFSNAQAFNSPIGNWNVSNVNDMSSMFSDAEAFNQDVSTWNVSSVTSMEWMFGSADVFNQDLSNWDVSNVTTMRGMFIGATSFNQDLSAWDVSNVTTMRSMFLVAESFDQDLGGWDITAVTTMENMLDDCGMSQANYDNTLIGWAAQDVQLNVILGAEDLTYCAGEEARASLIVDKGWTIEEDVNACPVFVTTWKTDNPGASNDNAIIIPTIGDGYDYDVDWDNDGVYDEFGLTGVAWHIYPAPGTYTVRIRGDFPRIQFNNTGDKDKIISIDQWGDILWEDMSFAFYGCTNLACNATDAPNLSNVASMYSMFEECSSLNQDINHWDVSNITDMSRMFVLATSFNQDLDEWDVSSVNNMNAMFAGAIDFNADISTWDVSSVLNMTDMFHDAISFNGDISGWDVSNVSTMEAMFNGAAAFNVDISSWVVSNVGIFGGMFSQTTSFNQNLGSWDIGNALTLSGMLNNSGLSTENYDNTLIGWAAQDVPQDLTLGALNLTYCAGKEARQHLIDEHGWTIDGDANGCVPFITTWKTDNFGTSNDNAIIIPTIGDGYDYDVDSNNDGIYDIFGLTDGIWIVFPDPGTYTIRIRGNFPRIHFNNEGDKDKLININQWGDIEWTSMNSAFYGCSNLDMTATDAPDLSTVNDMSHMFDSATSFNGDVSNWDVSNVTDMSNLFSNASQFNQDLDNWDVSNVTNMGGLFLQATQFNQDLDNWDVSNVTDMGGMFALTTNFEGDISTWDVSNVEIMGSMFHFASVFNGDLSAWDVSNVTDMVAMFHNANAFNSPINTWDVSNVEAMKYMFTAAVDFNQDISSWNVSNVTDMAEMFFGASAFNQDISSWDVSKVTDMMRMFSVATAFDQDLGSWDISQVLDMEEMLSDCGMSIDHYDNTLIGWAAQDVQQDINLGADGLFYCSGEAARSFLINTKGWTIEGDHKGCGAFITTWKTDNPGISDDNAIVIPVIGDGYDYDVDWDNDGVYDQFGITGIAGHIYPAPGTYTIRIRGDFPRIYFNNEGDKEKIINIDQWGSIEWTSMNSAFYGCGNLESSATDAPNLSNVTDMSNMFTTATSFNGDINGWDVSNVTNMSSLFKQNFNFNQDLDNWDVSSVTDMSNMFALAFDFNGDISTWNVSSVTNMNSMFEYSQAFNGNLNNWDVSNVTSMQAMFNNASTFNSPIGNWDVSNVTNMNWMFLSTINFNQDINSWDVSNVTNMRSMFLSADAFNQDLSNWDVSNVTTMENMFKEATLFDQDLGDWDISQVQVMEKMLSSCGMSIDNYDNTLIGWANQNVQVDMILDADGLFYCAGEIARQTLIDNFNWTINGDELECALLPIELMTFTAKVNAQHQVDIYWATTTETNNDYFLVQRSKDGVEFETVGEVAGSGNSTSPKYYELLDESPYTGTSYYRLQQIDFDGTSTYSEMVSVELALATAIQLFPNPTMDILNIRFVDHTKGDIHVQIYNSVGQLMIEKQLSEEEASSGLSLPEVARLEAGVYHVKINVGNEALASTFVKSKN